MLADEKSILAAPSLTIHRASLAGWQLRGAWTSLAGGIMDYMQLLGGGDAC